MDTIKIIIALLLIAGSAFADTLPSFAELYGIELLFPRLYWQGIERSYQEASKLA